MDGCALPGGRCGHACTSIDNMMYIHGGRLSSQLYDPRPCFTAELFSFDMSTLTWKELVPNYHQPPSGGNGGMPLPEGYMHLFRDRHSLHFVDGRIILFGGRGA